MSVECMKAVLFDLDGTLVSTSLLYVNSVVKKVLRELGGKTPSAEDVKLFWFAVKDRREMISEWGAPSTEFWRLFHEYSDSGWIEHTRVFGDSWVLGELHEKGIRTGVVTATYPPIAKMQLKKIGFGFDEIFFMTKTFNDYVSKPNPVGILHCLNKFRVSRAEACYVGNALEDVLTAKNAGVLDVLIDRKEHDCSCVDASVKINSLRELLELVK